MLGCTLGAILTVKALVPCLVIICKDLKDVVCLLVYWVSRLPSLEMSVVMSLQYMWFVLNSMLS